MKIFKNFRRIFCPSKKGVTNSIEEFSIPNEIGNNENIGRSIFSPINVNTKNNTLKANIFKPPAGYDEVSVNRFDFTNENYIKSISLKMQNPSKSFYGIAIVNVATILENEFNIVYSPIINQNKAENNIFHADIKIGCIVEKEVELPAEISARIKIMTKKTQLFVDNKPAEQLWYGPKIKDELNK